MLRGHLRVVQAPLRKRGGERFVDSARNALVVIARQGWKTSRLADDQAPQAQDVRPHHKAQVAPGQLTQPYLEAVRPSQGRADRGREVLDPRCVGQDQVGEELLLASEVRV